MTTEARSGLVRPRFRRVHAAHATLLALALFAPARAADTPAPLLHWRALAPLPDPVGLKGMYAGASDGHALFAGGSNFPVPPRAGGKKTFHRAVHVRPLAATEPAPWRTVADGLSHAAGEGAAVTLADGVACLGGHDGTQPLATAFVLRWDARTGALARRPLPDLPAACANPAAALAGDRLYVAGGESASGPLATLWRLDPRPPATGAPAARWAALPPPPGPARFGGILISVTTPAGPRLLYGGGLPGAPTSQADYLRDTWLFDPVKETWSPAAPLPRGAVLAAVVPESPVHALVLGGSDGHDFARMRELGERYRIPVDVLRYDATAGRWSHAGTMPLGLVGAAVVRAGDAWLIAGGEYTPGLRTAAVHALRVPPP